MNALKTSLLVLLLALLTACAASHVEPLNSKKPASSEVGYVLFSFGPAMQRAGMIHHNVVFREVTTGRETSVLFTRGALLLEPTPVDYTERGQPGAVYHVPLPAGLYEIARYRVFRPEASSYTIGYRFTVTPGQTFYLGRFRVGLDGMRGVAGVYGEFLDRYDEDWSIAQRRFAEPLKAFPLVGRYPH